MVVCVLGVCRWFWLFVGLGWLVTMVGLLVWWYVMVVLLVGFTGCLVVGFLVLVCLLWVSASVVFCLSGVRFGCVFVSLL